MSALIIEVAKSNHSSTLEHSYLRKGPGRELAKIH